MNDNCYCCKEYSWRSCLHAFSLVFWLLTSVFAAIHCHTHLLLTTTTHEGGSNRMNTTPYLHNFAHATLIVPTPFKCHILFKARTLSSSFLQPKGDWVYLCFQYYSRCRNPPSPVRHLPLFPPSLPLIPNILRHSSPELREVLRFTYC